MGTLSDTPLEMWLSIGILLAVIIIRYGNSFYFLKKTDESSIEAKEPTQVTVTPVKGFE